MATPMISAQNVHKSFGSLEVLKGITLDVMPGEVACLLGPSGSGKSTFLRCCNHLEKVTAGRLYVDGDLIGYRERDGVLYEITEKQAAAQRTDIGMVFQQFNLFAHRTVLENIIEAPVNVKKQPVEKAKKRAMELLEQVGLAHKADAYPVQLSGGQQQRVAIARAVAMEAEADAFRRADLRTRSRTRRRGITRDEGTRRGWNDHVGGHPRDGICPRSRRQDFLHGRRPSHRIWHSAAGHRRSAAPANQGIPLLAAIASLR